MTYRPRYDWFGLAPKTAPDPAETIEARYALALICWDAQHNADRHDMTPAQRKRWLQWIASLNGGFSVQHAVFWWWLVATGRWTR